MKIGLKQVLYKNVRSGKSNNLGRIFGKFSHVAVYSRVCDLIFYPKFCFIMCTNKLVQFAADLHTICLLNLPEFRKMFTEIDPDTQADQVLELSYANYKGQYSTGCLHVTRYLIS